MMCVAVLIVSLSLLLAQIESMWPTGSQRLFRHQRIYVLEGTLQKLCRKGLKPRHFFLFNDILVCLGLWTCVPPQRSSHHHHTFAGVRIDAAEGPVHIAGGPAPV